MPLRLFASRQRTGAYLVQMLHLGAMIAFFFFTSQYLKGVLAQPCRTGGTSPTPASPTRTLT